MNLLIVGWLVVGLIWASLIVVGIQMQSLFSLSFGPSRLTLIGCFIFFLLMGPIGVLLTLLAAFVRRFVDIRIWWRR